MSGLSGEFHFSARRFEPGPDTEKEVPQRSQLSIKKEIKFAFHRVSHIISFDFSAAVALYQTE
jgi:hypothetical protein